MTTTEHRCDVFVASALLIASSLLTACSSQSPSTVGTGANRALPVISETDKFVINPQFDFAHAPQTS